MTPISAFNDPQTVRRQYVTDEGLRVRQEIHDTYTVPRFDHAKWVVECLQWRGDETVLDVGSGPGRYYEAVRSQGDDVRYLGMDYSAGMLTRHPAPSHLLLGDAQRLPLADDSADVVMANHMLYHVADIDEAIIEFRRVLKPGGSLLVATNSTTTMPELQVLMRRAIVLLTRSGVAKVKPPAPASDNFSLESGTRWLSRHFYGVVRHDMPSVLLFPDIEPVMKYLESTRAMREPQLPDDVEWDDVMMIIRQQLTHLIHHLGELVIQKLTGVLIASDRGDFLHGFVEKREAIATG